MIDTLALGRALMGHDAMGLRILVAEIMLDPLQLARAPEPDTTVGHERAAAAAIVELLCERAGITPPDWVSSVPALSEPHFVLSHAQRLPRLRALCLEESPPALRRRGFLAPPDFLTTA
jgi:hypothetical protein